MSRSERPVASASRLAGAARAVKPSFATERACPVCSHQFPWFLPFGVGLPWRWGVLCPFCRSLERHRLVWLYVGPRLEQLPRLLHVAPERCFEPRLRRLLADRYTTTDFAAPGVDVRASLEQLPFADASFDALICNHVLEHVHDDARALSELFRVLAPGAWAVLQAPVAYDHARTREDPGESSARERKRRFGQHDHVRWYGTDYPERIARAGFSVEALPVQLLHSADEARRYGLGRSEVLYIGHKRAVGERPT